MQIIVFGMHRSGTSLVTRLINMLGAYFGPEKASIGFGPDNPRGFWERRDVMVLNDELMALNACTWDRLAAWPLGGVKPMEPKQKRAMRSLILDMDAHRPWVIKDPRFCMTFDYWRPFLEVPVCVVAYRSPIESARSLEKRNNIPLQYGLALWEYHAVSMLNAIDGLPVIHVAHAEALHDPVGFTHLLKDKLEHEEVRGLRLPSDREILGFVDPSLHRAKASEDEENLLSPHQQMIASLMKGESVQHAGVDISEASIRLMRAGF